MSRKFAFTIILFCIFQPFVFSQLQTNPKLLAELAKQYRETENKSFQTVTSLAHQKGWPLTLRTRSGGTASLIGVDAFGLPLYYTTENNIIAAATTRTNLLWPGGSSNLNLSGSSINMKNRMGLWDGGKPRPTHVELTGRINQRDNPASIDDHSTHVAGTLMATGVNPVSKGMAFGLLGLAAYDFNNDVSEMSGEAANLVLSNHSYGTIAGWYYNSDSTRWEFWGRSTDNEDYKFGFYDNKSQLWDSIAYNAPFYLIVKSVGNNRSENGPAVGQPYYRYNASNQMQPAGNRPAGISSNDGYDIVATNGVAKNILTIGAVNGIPFGYSRKEDVILSNFTSFGPTDDGRIKPDLVADGVNLTSSIGTSDNSYATYSGTSMSTPNVTGSLLLLQEYYSQLHAGAFMRSSTLKGLAIHTADEAGPADGPDYQYGWGLLNVAKAAEVLQSNNAGNHLIYENVLNNGGSFSTTVVASGQGPLVVTLAWIDPKASVDNVNVLNNRTKKLVDDLDVRITRGATTYMPWILDPNSPASAATTGDNVLDNVERINVNDVVPGQAYTITVTHKGVLERSTQAYSLIISGAGGQAYCASAPSTNSGSRIDNVSFGNILQANPTGCTTYTNYTAVSTPIQANQTIPITIKVGSCDATVTNKIIKVFIDYNSNGVFTDAGELVATSGVLSGTATFTTNIVTPSNLTLGNSSIMRIVLQDANAPASVNSCGAYANGETQDYKVTFAAPSSDLSVVELTAPELNACANPAQLVVMKIRNNSTAAKSNVPVSVIIKNGATTVATLTAIYPDVIDASSVATYTFQTPFTTIAGTTYSFSAVVSATDDQNRNNDTLKTTVTIATAPTTPTGLAEICGSSTLLRANNTGASNYFWYSSAVSEAPIAVGTVTSTTVIPAANTYFLATGARGTVGLANKTIYPVGGYLTSNSANYMKFSASVPVILESVKLYTKYHGTINFIVADILSTTSTGYTYQPLSTTAVDVYSTSPTPAPGTQAVYDAADTGATFYVNLSLPAGDHVIIVQPQGDANLFRNNNVTGSPYPFTLPNIISFTGNSATLATDPNYYQGFYYFLYNMKVRTADCISARVPIVATVPATPTITQSNDSLVSSAASGNQWYLNGVGVPGATDKKYKPLQSGNYTVVVTDAVGCQVTSAAYNFVLTAITPVDAQEIGLRLSPNPNDGTFTMSFKVEKKNDLQISVVNIQGQSCYEKIYPGFIGNFSQQFNLKKLASGVYIIKIQQGNKIYYKKIIIEGN